MFLPTTNLAFVAVILAGAVTGTVACSEEPLFQVGPGPDGSKRDAASAPDSLGEPDGGEVPVVKSECSVVRFAEENPPHLFERLEAAVVDTRGTAVPSMTAQACGTDVCLDGKTGANGSVVINATQSGQSVRKLAFKYGDGLRYAQFALRLPNEPVHLLDAQVTQALPPLQDAMRFELGGTLRSGDVEIDLGSDTEVLPNLLFFHRSEEQVFLAAEFPGDRFPEAVDPELGIEQLLVLGPLKTQFCPAVKLRVTNRAGWNPGELVEVLLHGTEVTAEWVPFAEWRKVSAARVTDDGDSIETLDGEGIPMLGVIGLRRGS